MRRPVRTRMAAVSTSPTVPPAERARMASW